MATYVINESGSNSFTFPTNLNKTDILRFNNTSTGINGTMIDWEVPNTGIYRIKTYGAYGYIGLDTLAGKGAHLEGNFKLQQGDILRILVGQLPTKYHTTYGGSGGGTFVTKVVSSGGHEMYDGTRVIPLIISGGGGGGSNSHGGNVPSISDASLTTSGKDSHSNLGGTDGNGGEMASSNTRGWGGGGFLTDGEGGTTYDVNGKSFLSGGVGGWYNDSYSGGGFGCGGSGLFAGGGAGGYSGGAGCTGLTGSNRIGGGGGSYNDGEETFAELRDETTNDGHGFVEIEFFTENLLFIKTNNTFKLIKSIFRKKEGIWKSPIQAFMKINEKWKPFSVHFIQQVLATFSGNGTMPSDIYGWTPLEISDYSSIWPGRNFEGWDPLLPKTIFENTNFISQWSITASFNTDGGIVINDIISDISSNPSLYIEEIEPNKPGYEFTHWSPTIPTTITENTTFTAHWEEINVEAEEYITFQSDEPFTLKTNNEQKHWNGSLYYSTDAQIWSVWNGSEISSNENKIHICGLENTYITNATITDWVNRRWVLNGSDDIECFGNIASILDYQDVENSIEPEVDDNCFAHMFSSNSNLISAPELSLTTIKRRMYTSMFSNCWSLMKAPELPATTLDTGAYENMFYACTSLIEAPELPATGLAAACYRRMFFNCTSLATIFDELPNYTSGGIRIYQGMFEGCTSLIEPPNLLFTSIPNWGAVEMFKNCTSLIKAPNLLPTSIATASYEGMFEGCISLKELPQLPGTQGAIVAYSKMFKDCTNVMVSETQEGIYTKEWRIPSSGTAGTFGDNWNRDMLIGTGGTFTSDPELDTTYYIHIPNYITFQSNQSFTLATRDEEIHWDGTLYYSTDRENWSTWDGSEINSSGNKLFIRGLNNTYITNAEETVDRNTNSWILDGPSNIQCLGNIETLLDYENVENEISPTMSDYCFAWMFWDNENLITAPELPATTLSEKCYIGMFTSCTNLLTPPKLPATTLTDSCYAFMFSRCDNLLVTPELPATILAEDCYRSMFFQCISLLKTPELPATTLLDGSYHSMFYNCTSLINGPEELPATTIPRHTYQNMFRGCISLEKAPEILGNTVGISGYNRMFEGCSSLIEAPELPATDISGFGYSNMFENCTSLKEVPELPATTILISQYQYMFKGCTSLEKVVNLPAINLNSFCYNQMFENCTNIKISETQTGDYIYEWRIPTEGTGSTALSWNEDMLNGTGGAFTGDPEINTTYYTTKEPK